MPNAINPSAVAAAGGIVNFSWTNNAGAGKAQATDKPVLVVYCTDLQQSIYDIGADRSVETSALNVAAFSGLKVETWIGFISETGKEVATSIFTGEVTVI
jgi:hypothetical protein